MTKSAIDLAREALHRGHASLRNHEISDLAAVERAYSEISQALAALAALTTEQSRVPPDREMVAKKLETATASYDEMREAAAIIRQPAPAEIPPGIAGLIADIRAKGGYITCPDMLDFLNIVERAMARRQPAPAEVEAMAYGLDTRGFHAEATMLRRLALPAVGDWRPIASAPKGDGDEGPDVILFGPMMPGYKRSNYIENSRWYRTDWTITWMDGHLAPTHWQPLPAPPIPEEPSR